MIAAAVSFAATMIAGFTGLTVMVYRNRGRTQPATEPPIPEPPRTVYEHTTAALGDPTHIDLTPPPFTWPTS
jgi:hypothetical protein